MAELLINLRHVSDDTWMPGQVIAIMPDGHKWGLDEKPPKFFVMQLPGVSIDKVRKLLESEYDDEHDTKSPLPRVWRELIDKIPETTMQTARNAGRIKLNSTDWDQIISLGCIRNESKFRRDGSIEHMRDTAKDLGMTIEK